MPAQQVQTLQLYSDLLSLAAQQLAVPTINEKDRDELITMVKLVGSAIAVTADPNSPLAIASKGVMDIQKALPPDQILLRVNALHPAILKTPKFAAVKPPPKIVDHKPAPAPATEPTTLPAGAARRVRRCRLRPRWRNRHRRRRRRHRQEIVHRPVETDRPREATVRHPRGSELVSHRSFRDVRRLACSDSLSSFSFWWDY
jgi:hypothetical protein